ncbi:ARM repeat superfamily protein [Actinidia rufa]|uniref:ARM repeat superfamily protein n=1 Tax=Actinidia rufa TaxID=165716 RepID=A0A7J0FIP5_9ERIC|nr:ARM repeat superfamily protein [Actinidia rufa]
MRVKKCGLDAGKAVMPEEHMPQSREDELMAELIRASILDHGEPPSATSSQQQQLSLTELSERTRSLPEDLFDKLEDEPLDWQKTRREGRSRRGKCHLTLILMEGDEQQEGKWGCEEKGTLEPHAYWPLDLKMMSRRPEKRTVARKGMASVVKMTKKLEE